jgi:hypothetical protein
MTTKSQRDRREAAHLFHQLRDSTITHLRVGQGPGHRTAVTLLGHARELHGLDGVCTCCPRRPAGEPTGREQSIAAARRAADRAAELGPRQSARLAVDVELHP